MKYGILLDPIYRKSSGTYSIILIVILTSHFIPCFQCLSSLLLQPENIILTNITDIK